MEYTIIGKVFPIILKNIAKKELKKYFSNIEIKDIIKNTKTEYKNIIYRTPNMGGNKNYYIGIMYLGIYLIALYRNINKKVMLEEYSQLMQNGLRNCTLLKLKMGSVNYFSKKYKKGLYKRTEWAKNNETKYPWTWQIRIPKNKKNKGIYFEFTKCGLCELCKSENVSELTPLMCEMDFISFSFANCRLVREKTLSNGNEYCDFWIRKNE